MSRSSPDSAITETGVSWIDWLRNCAVTVISGIAVSLGVSAAKVETENSTLVARSAVLEYFIVVSPPE